MSLKCAIVGLPNVGKSTLFNTLTKAQIQAENYPFCTIDPNVGTVEVPDPRINKLCEIVKPQKVQNAIVEFVDVAGLVKGASKGEGLGNQFLAHIRETKAIINVVRCFDDPNIIHVQNRVDPVEDFKTIQTEIALADLSTLEKSHAREVKKNKSADKNSKIILPVIEHAQKLLNEEQSLKSLSIEEIEILKPLNLLSVKPSIIVANVNEHSQNHLNKLKDFASSLNIEVLDVCILLESEISELDEDEKLEFLNASGVKDSGLNRIIKSGYDLLGLQTYFTAGVKEVRAWTIKKGDKAPSAAGVIHSDFERGFIRAQVVSFDDFVNCGGWNNAKEKGLMRLEGKDYVVVDGDVINFLFNV